MEGTAGWSMRAGVLRGPLVVAALFAIVLPFGAIGPICGRVLADLGTEVVRVENPDGEGST